LNVNSLPADVQMLRYLLLAGMTGFTLVFLNRDMLYPLLAGNRRWRSKPRLYVQVPMHVWYQDDPSSKMPIVLHNCSHNGLGLSGPTDRLRALFDRKDQLNHFLIHVGHAGKNWMLNVTLIRTKQEEAVLYAGLRVHNTEVMADFIGQVETLMPPQNTLGRSFSRYWVRSGFRHAMIALWAVSMLGVMIMPACAHQPNRQASAESQRTSAASTSRVLSEPRPFLSKANSPPY
jgi:hypothetical protein